MTENVRFSSMKILSPLKNGQRPLIKPLWPFWCIIYFVYINHTVFDNSWKFANLIKKERKIDQSTQHFVVCQGKGRKQAGHAKNSFGDNRVQSFCTVISKLKIRSGWNFDTWFLLMLQILLCSFSAKYHLILKLL